MLSVRRIEPRELAERRLFLALAERLYGDHPQWVPPLRADLLLPLDRSRHPYYEHSDADFLVASRGARAVGRLAVMENRPFNRHHGKHWAGLSLFDCEDDREAAAALFRAASDWARARGLDRLVGPRGFGPFDGYGLLVRGFEHRRMMTMTAYNPAYYERLFEDAGFRKEVDFVSYAFRADTFELPRPYAAAAERARRNPAYRVLRFERAADLRRFAARIGEAYNRAFVGNWEYYPLTERELRATTDAMLAVTEPRLVKVITHEGEVIGFLLAFPDLSAGLQRAKGRLFPVGLLHLLIESRRTRGLSLNGVGILPTFRGRGGNALLYAEIQRTVQQEGRFLDVEVTQVAETATRMRADLTRLGARVSKIHRVYAREVPTSDASTRPSEAP